MKLRKILLFACLMLVGCREEIAHDLTDREVGRVVTALSDAGVYAERKRQGDGTWIISVASERAEHAMQLLERHRLIRAHEEPPQESSIFLSDKEQSLRYERSLSQSIEKTLYALDGVYDVKVHLTFPPSDSLLGMKKDLSASGTGSVLIIASPDMLATPEEISGLVAGASGLAAEKISVLIKPGRPLTLDSKLEENIPRESLSINTLICALLLIGIGILLLRFKTSFSKGSLFGAAQ